MQAGIFEMHHGTELCEIEQLQDTKLLQLAEGKRVPLSSVQSLYHVELKSSLRLRLVH